MSADGNTPKEVSDPIKSTSTCTIACPAIARICAHCGISWNWRDAGDGTKDAPIRAGLRQTTGGRRKLDFHPPLANNGEHQVRPNETIDSFQKMFPVGLLTFASPRYVQRRVRSDAYCGELRVTGIAASVTTSPRRVKVEHSRDYYRIKPLILGNAVVHLL